MVNISQYIISQLKRPVANRECRAISNIIGIWCHTDKFARKEGLRGLFSGMIISDIKERKSSESLRYNII